MILWFWAEHNSIRTLLCNACGTTKRMLLTTDGKSCMTFQRDKDQQPRLLVLPLNMHRPRATALSRAADGQVHLAVATDPMHREVPWFDPALELLRLALGENSAPLRLAQLTDTDPDVARYMPAVEKWDWTRPEVCASTTCG